MKPRRIFRELGGFVGFIDCTPIQHSRTLRRDPLAPIQDIRIYVIVRVLPKYSCFSINKFIYFFYLYLYRGGRIYFVRS